MKNLSKTSFIFLSIILFVACQQTKQNSTIATTTSETQKYQAIGVIKNIDAENNRLKIDHDDIKGYMSAMEMDFSVNDKLLLESSKVGDKVEFELERKGADLSITKLNKIGEVTILDGAEIYKTNCATCHGEQGEGTKKGIPLTSGHALHHSETEHIQQVADGEGDKMPAFKDKLSTEQIANVVKFVREDFQKNQNREQSEKHSH